MSDQVGARPGGYETAIHGNRWHALLYELMRDGLVAPGDLHARVERLADCDDVFAFANDFLAAYAIELNARLFGLAHSEAHVRAHAAIAHAAESSG